MLGYLGGLPPDELACVGMEKLRTVHYRSYSIDCNWKAAADAFMEVYHINTIHPTNAGIMLNYKAAGMRTDGRTAIRAWRRARTWTRASTSSNRRRSGHPLDAGSSIATITSPTESSRTSSRQWSRPDSRLLMFWPRGVHQCEMERSTRPRWGEGDRPPFWDQLPPPLRCRAGGRHEESRAHPELAHFGAFSGMMINYQERRIYWFHEEIDRRIGAGNVPEGLAVKPLLSAYMEQSVAEAATG